jgi:hypothetical protein
VEPKGLPQQVLRELEKPLDWSRVRKKPGPGNFDYLPHDDVTRTANRIFGYDGWGYTTDEVTCVSQGPFSREGRQGYLAAYTARVTLRVRLQDGTWLLRGGTGEGFHMEYSEIAQAVVHGKAAKAAESDALKRAFMRFGDQFGLILYAEEGERAALQAEAEARRGRPLAPGDRPAREEEIEELLSLARRLDEARGTQDLAEKVARASLEEHRARTEDGVVSADWLRRQITRLIELLAQVERPQTTVERPEPRFRPPDSVQEEMAAVDEADIEAAFSSAFREEAA